MLMLMRSAFDRGLVEPMGTFRGLRCANCHSFASRVKSHTAYDTHESDRLHYSRQYFPGLEFAVGYAADMELAKLPEASLLAVVVKKRTASVYSEHLIEVAAA